MKRKYLMKEFKNIKRKSDVMIRISQPTLALLKTYYIHNDEVCLHIKHVKEARYSFDGEIVR